MGSTALTNGCPATPTLPVKSTSLSTKTKATPQEQTITVAEALRMYTSAGANAEGTGHRKGTIQPGMLADMVLLNTDPITAEPEQLKEIRVVLTVLGGEVVWEGGH